MATTETLKIKITGQNDSGKSFADIDNDIKDVGKEGLKMGDALKGALVGAAAAGVAAIAGIGVAALNVSNDLTKSQNDLQAQLGLSAENAKQLNDVVKEVYKNNFGETIADVNDAVADVFQNLSAIGVETDEQLQKATETALGLRDAFGVDVAESANAARALVEEFGITSEEAFNAITSGFQAGLNNSDDFLDSIREYSNQFKEGGASVDEFFNFLAGGMKSGVLGTDKAGDMFKEFVVRIQDGSKLTAESLDALGLNSKKILKDLASGATDEIDVFNQVQKALRNSNNEALIMQAGVGLLGTQFEDLGKEAVFNIDTMTDKWTDNSEAVEKLNKQYDDLPNVLSGMKRQALLSLQPIGDAITDIINIMMFNDLKEDSFLAETFGKESTLVSMIFATRQAIIDLKDQLLELGKGYMQVYEQLSPTLNELWGSLVNVFNQAKPSLIELGNVLINFRDRFVNEVLPVLLPAIQEIYLYFKNAFDYLAPTIGPVMATVVDIISTAANAIIEILKGLITMIKGIVQIMNGILTGDVAKIGEGFANIFIGAGQVIVSVLKGAINGIIDLINGGIRSINGMKAPDWLGGASPNISLIPRLAKGGDFITSGPQMIMVGDNPGGRERVQVTPLSSSNVNGPKGSDKAVNISISFPNYIGTMSKRDAQILIDMLIPKIKQAI